MRTLLLWIAAAVCHAQNRAPAIETIRREDMKADLFFLAGDGMKGRLTNTPEYALAAEWVASRFERLGLKGLGEDGSFFQPFDLVYARLGERNSLTLVEGGGKRLVKLGEEYHPAEFSVNAEVSGTTLDVGFGVVAPEHNWDDYKGRETAGRIVVIQEGDPEPDNPKSVFDGLVTSEHGGSLRKVITAQERGARAVIFVPTPEGRGRFSANYWPKNPPRIERYQLATNADKVRIPVVRVSRALAPNLKDGAEVQLTVSVNRITITDRNVVAVLEGSDPKLKDEAVILSAHHDHDGATAEAVLNGADDNGSGTVAVIEMAEAYVSAARAGRRPKRSVIFALWGSEERGLLGSWAWIDKPLWPLKKTAATLNMDMIGRNEEVPVGGGARFLGLKPQTGASNANSVHIMGYSFNPQLADVARTANRDIDLTLRMEYDNSKSNLVRRSDQWPFLQHRVPAIFFHTGLHPDYHRPSDRPERIEYAKMERIVKLVYQTSWSLSDSAVVIEVPARRQIPEAQ
jgi:hypothetical protein